MAVFKGRNGFEGKDDIPFEGPDGINNLNLYTFKGSRGELVSGVQAVKVGKSGNFNSVSFTVFQDFGKRYLSNKVRCTEKAVCEQHAKFLAMKDEIIAEAKDFYAKKAALEGVYAENRKPGGPVVYPSRIDS